MNYKEALEYINDKNKFGSKLGLESIEKLLELLGNPEENIKYIHVGGTNGKGSTSSFILSMLMEAGYNVGTFTSPFINRFNERIQLNKKDIPNHILGKLTGKVKEQCDLMVKKGYNHPTTFEIVTAIAFLYFKHENVDFAILEVGLGGRYDSTNIIKNAEAVVLTSISMDHTDVLGDTLGKIAYEKAGIIKEGSLITSYMQDEEVEEVLLNQSNKKKGRIYFLKKSNIEIKNITNSGSVYNYRDNNYYLKGIRVNLIGKHQIYNSALAIKTIISLKEEGIIEIDDYDIIQGIEKTFWPARLELLNENPTILIDGAHNVNSVESLIDSINLFEYDELILVLGILKDKDYKKIIELLMPISDKVIATEINTKRKLKAEELKLLIKSTGNEVYLEKDINKAIRKSLELANENDLILFAGSLYLVSVVREKIKEK